MSTLKECKVVILSTNYQEPKKGDILLRHLWKNDPKLECRSIWQYKDSEIRGNLKVYTTMNGSFCDVPSAFKLQHLYIVSNEEIKEGDYCICANEVVFGPYEHQDILIEAKKIIATTDLDLSLPSPSKGFVKKYVKEQGIDTINVEYTNRCCGRCNGVHDTCYTYLTCNEHNIEGCEDCYGKVGDIPKVANDNTITIHPIKDSWNEPEMLSNMQYYMEYCQRNGYVTPKEWLTNYKHY